MATKIRQILEGQFGRLRTVGNHDGQRHLATWATEVRASGNAAQRRRTRRVTVRMVRRLAA